jgi:hypothetical protein
MRKMMLVALFATSLVVFMAPGAMALTVSPDPGVDMVAGNVYALNPAGSWIYVGGKFTAIRDQNNVNICGADNLARFNESTGQGDCTFTPQLPGTSVDGIAVVGGYAYAGGDFGLVRVNTSTGMLDNSFAPGVGNTVHTVLAAPDGSGVYIGGAFQRVNGVKRSELAFIKTDGTLGSWSPGADNVVRRLRWSSAGYIVASGAFEHVGGHFDQSIAEIDPDGSVHAGFNPHIAEVGAMTCFDTAPTASIVYAACGQTHNFMAAFDASTGAKVWRKGLGGNGESVVLTSVGATQTLFVGGHFGTRSPTSMPCGTTYLHGVLKADPVTGAIDCSWDPHLFPDTNNYTGGWVEEVTNGHLWLGGKFGKVSGAKHHALARWTL